MIQNHITHANTDIDITSPTALTQALVQSESITPAAKSVFDKLEIWLSSLGFTCHRMIFNDEDTPDVENFYASFEKDTKKPHFLFAGHVDVVPIGEEKDWMHPPFEGHIVTNKLYGRGTVDMKGGVGAFIAAVARFLNGGNDFGKISFLITGDEEGPAINGTNKLLEWAAAKGEKWDHCLLGEPTNSAIIGDVIKVGRRGSLTGSLTIQGQQGHVAYPHLALNPIPVLAHIISRLAQNDIDKGTNVFQPSNLEFVNIDIGNQASNVIANRAKARFNIRYNDLQNEDSLAEYLHKHIKAVLPEGYSYTLTFEPSNSPVFRTEAGDILSALQKAIKEVTNLTPMLTTGGGTSDGRFIKDYCPIIEFGLVGETMHKVDEHTSLHDLEQLTLIYEKCLLHYFK